MQRIRKLPPLPARDSEANKGDCGRVLVVGGSRGMAGAPTLAAKAAYRSGAGLVKLAIPMSIWDVVAAKLDEVTTVGLPETRRGTIARRALEQVPEGSRDWKPHDKSMAFGYLCDMVATIPSWLAMIVKQDELDVAPSEGSGFRPPPLAGTGSISASASGNSYCDFNPLLIGFQVSPLSSLRKAPAAEMAT